MGLTEFQINKLFNTFLTPDGAGGFKVKVDMAISEGGSTSNTTEATQLLVKAAVQAIAAKDFATETTLSAFLNANHLDLSALVGKDFASQTTLAAMQVALNSFITANHADLSAIAGKDFANETTLKTFLIANHSDLSAFINSDHTDLSLILSKLISNPATETTLAALQVAFASFIAANHADLSAIAGKDFATETTLKAILATNHFDLSAFINSNHADLGLILSKLIANPATETTLAALLAANHIDLLAIKSSIDAMGIEHTTYSVVIRNLTIASLTTDFITISGSATKTIKINEIQFSATATSAQVKDFVILKRKTLNTGGTSTLCNPIALDSNSPACTAIVKAYTANPTVLGTLIGEVRVAKYQFNSTNSLPDYIEYKFNENNNQHLTLRGLNESVALNLNAQTVNGANVDCYIEFDEY